MGRLDLGRQPFVAEFPIRRRTVKPRASSRSGRHRGCGRRWRLRYRRKFASCEPQRSRWQRLGLPKRTRPRLLPGSPALSSSRRFLRLKANELLLFRGGRPVVAQTIIMLRLLDPIPNALFGGLELSRELGRSSTGVGQSHDLLLELLGVWSSSASHLLWTLPRRKGLQCPRKGVNSNSTLPQTMLLLQSVFRCWDGCCRTCGQPVDLEQLVLLHRRE